MLGSRRFVLGIIAIICLTVIALAKDIDTSIAIATTVGSVAAASAYQKRGNNNDSKMD